MSDSPELTEADFKHARPRHEVFPGLAEAVARRRGRPKSEAPKVQINLRLDPDVLDAYRAGGPGWQTRMNAALRAGLLAGATGATRAVEPPKRSRPGAAAAMTDRRGTGKRA